VSEDGEADDGEEALSVPGLLGQDLLDITTAQAFADDDLGNSLRVSSHPSCTLCSACADVARP
jgi:hypothetical protein